jgi:membrane-bound lytic murein transglycosylase D
MNNKRLLLLGITIMVISTGWMYPSFPDAPGSRAITTPAGQSPIDTERVAEKTSEVSAISGSNSPQNDLYKELFVAASVGSSNGVRLNPRALTFVQDYIKDNWDELTEVRTQGKSYFNLIENILAGYGLPKELKYLAVIESNLKRDARSKVGAVGPWQLMPQTARDLGLKVNRNVDERKNYIKSTRAAALYLRDLYNNLGDWLLVIAAYNGGTAHVYHAIHRSGSKDFWDLQDYLPAESRIHVKKFIATQYTFEGQGSITTLTRAEAAEQLPGSSLYAPCRKLTPAELENAKTISVSGKYYSTVVARYVIMDISEFSRYNPSFDKVMASTNNTYEMKLPSDKMELFAANKYQILNESAQLLLNGDQSVPVSDTQATASK